MGKYTTALDKSDLAGTCYSVIEIMLIPDDSMMAHDPHLTNQILLI